MFTQQLDNKMMANIMEMAKRNSLEVMENDRAYTLCKSGEQQRLMWTADICELMLAMTAIDWYRNG